MCDVYLCVYLICKLHIPSVRAMQLKKIIFVDMKGNLSNVMLTPRNANCGRGLLKVQHRIKFPSRARDI